MHPRRLTTPICGLLLGFAAAIGTSWAGTEPKLASTEPAGTNREPAFALVDVDQALAATESWLKQHPRDARGYFILGQLHAMSWMHTDPAWKSGNTAAMPKTTAEGTLAIPIDPQIWIFRTTGPDKLPWTTQETAHLQSSINAYRKGIELDPHVPLRLWAAAMVFGQAALNPGNLTDAHEKSTPDDEQKFAGAITRLADSDFKIREAATRELAAAMPKDIDLLQQIRKDDGEVSSRITQILRDYWHLQELKYFRMAYTQTVADELKVESFDDPYRPISLYTGRAILGILRDYPAAAEKQEIPHIAEAVEKLQKIPNPAAPHT